MKKTIRSAAKSEGDASTDGRASSMSDDDHPGLETGAKLATKSVSPARRNSYHIDGDFFLNGVLFLQVR